MNGSESMQPNGYLGVAQLVARGVRDAEVVSSSLITQTTYKILVKFLSVPVSFFIDTF